jgi:hypothetical protein
MCFREKVCQRARQVIVQVLKKDCAAALPSRNRFLPLRTDVVGYKIPSEPIIQAVVRFKEMDAYLLSLQFMDSEYEQALMRSDINEIPAVGR